MGKVLCFIYDEMADFEMTLACSILNGERELITISSEKEIIKAISGIKYVADITVGEALLLNDVEALIIPGGLKIDDSDEIFQLINKLNDEKKLLCAICAGPTYLAIAGVLEGHTYATTADAEYLKNAGIKDDPFNRENYLEKGVVRDGNIITARGNYFVDFAMEIIDGLGLFDNQEQKIMFSNHYKGITEN